MQRRKFLRKLSLSAVSVSALLQSCSKDPFFVIEDENAEASDTVQALSNNSSVIVVGAGASGMYAASWLKAKGMSVTILEASNRHGGRIKPLTDFADFPIEAGAEIIHGRNTILFKWAKQLGAQFVQYGYTDYYRLDGQLMTEAQISGDADVNAAWGFVDSVDNYNGPDKTISQRITQVGLPARVHHIVNADLGNDWRTDNDHLSIKGIAEENDAWTAGETDHPMRNKTFLEILETKFANILPDIQYNKQIVRVEYPTGTAKPKVKDQNGNWHEADAVLLTVPLAILKNNSIEFSPALPATKTTAIQNIGMGAGMKVIMKFSTRFWPNSLRYLVSDQLGHVCWFTSKQRGTTPVLTFFVMGSRAETLSAQGNGAIATLLGELDGLYNGAATAAYVDAHIEDWGADPFIKGAYSFPLVNGGGLDTRYNLAQKLNNKLFFAGEATHFDGHNSTVHGALETGLRAAREIWNVLG